MAKGLVGTTIRNLLHTWHIEPTAECRCEDLAKKYDDAGVDWCTENQIEIVDEIYDNATKHKSIGRWAGYYPRLTKFFIRRLVQTAIRRAS